MESKEIKIQNEVSRLQANFEALKQTRYKMENVVFQFNMPKDYYVELLPRLSEIKGRCLSFYYEMAQQFREDNEIIILNDEIKNTHMELKTAYKETADYMSELHLIAKEKAENTETKDYFHIFNSEQGYKIFKAWREYTNDDTKIINFEFIFHQLSYDNYLVDDLKPSVFLNYLQSIDIPKFGRIQGKEKIEFNGKRCEKFKKEYYKIKDIS